MRSEKRVFRSDAAGGPTACQNRRMLRDYATSRPRRIEFTDVYGFAGGQAVGAAQAGMELRRKIEEPSAFGAAACLDPRNAPQLGRDWEMVAADPMDWPPCETPVVLSNPPCSGFSLAAKSTERYANNDGPLSTHNTCMWHLWHWVADSRAQTGNPKVAAMESVTRANSVGDDLMGQLAAASGMPWQYRVVQNVAALGGPQLRRRFWLVMSDEPLLWPADLLDYAGVSAVPTLAEALSGLPDNPPAGAWALPRLAGDCDGHAPVKLGASRARAMLALLRAIGDDWPIGESGIELLPRLTAAQLDAAEAEWPGARAKLVRLADRIDANKVFRETVAVRLDPGRVCHTMVSSFTTSALHWSAGRYATVREAMRLAGLPDSWSAVEYARSPRTASDFPPKGVVADAGRWLAAVIGDNLCGEATGRGWWSGDERDPLTDSSRAFTVDCRLDHKAVVDEKTGERRDSRTDAWADDMSRRREAGNMMKLL